MPASPSRGPDLPAVLFAFAAVALAGLSTYVVFLLFGAVFGNLSGVIFSTTFRWIVSALLATILPGLLVIRELTVDSNDNRFQRLKVLSVVVTVINLATLLLVSCLMPGQITEELRSEPNWFLGSSTIDASTIGTTNASLSRNLADAIATTTTGMGLYTPPGSDEKRRRSRRSSSSEGSDASPDAGTTGEAATGSEESQTAEADPTDNSQDSESESRRPRSAMELMEESSADAGDESAGRDEAGKDEEGSRKSRSALELMEQQSDEETPDAGEQKTSE